jgi:hypothetical protein
MGGNANWSNGGNWSLKAPPGPMDLADFTSGSSVKFTTSVVDTAFTIAELSIASTWGGTINVNSMLSVTGDFHLSSGTFQGNGAVTISGNGSLFDGGQITLGTGGFLNKGTLTIDTTFGSQVISGPGTFTNRGTINEVNINTIALQGHALLNNAIGATFDFESDCGITNNGTFTNAGTLEKTGGTGTSTIQCATFNNNGGAVSVQQGTLALISGGLLDGGTFTALSNALFNVEPQGVLSCTGSFTGAGGGTVALSSTLTIASTGATFNLPGQLLQCTGTIDVSSGGAFINEGTLNLNSTTFNVGLTGANGAGTLLNLGTINQSGAGIVLSNTAVLTNAGIYDITGDGNIGVNGSGTFLNAGLLTKTMGMGTSTIGCALSNTGLVQVHTGTIDVTGNVAQVLGQQLTGGSWYVFGRGTVHSTLTIASAGTLTTLGRGATVILIGPNTTFGNLSGLANILPGGSFQLFGGQSFTTTGPLTNSGSLFLSPGSLLTVSGSFTQTPTGTLTVQAGGTSASPKIGSIKSTTGIVTLDGKLMMTSTVVPAVGTHFTVLDNETGAAISGIFAGLPEGSTFSVTVGSTTMTFKISYAGGSNGRSVSVVRVH